MGKQDHLENNKVVPWKQLLSDKRNSYSTIQSYMVKLERSPINFSQACGSCPRISKTASQILVSTDSYSESRKLLTMFIAEVQKDSQLQSRCMAGLQISTDRNYCLLGNILNINIYIPLLKKLFARILLVTQFINQNWKF